VLQLFGLNLRHLDAVIAVAEARSISAAALAVNMSQPALTQAVARLEQRLGQALFERQRQGVRLTRAGELFLRRGARGLDQLAESIGATRRSARLPVLAHPERAVSATQLRAFAAVERTGSFAAAARGIALSQPSVHRAARELELVIGTPLLVRVGQAMRATPAGQRIARGIRLALGEWQAGLDEVEALAREGAGQVRVGTLPLPRAGLVPAALARFAPAHPGARITVIEGPYAELLFSLRGGEIDLLVGALRDPVPDGLVQRSLFDDELFVVARAGHPLAGTRPAAKVLAGYPWVVGAHGAPMRATWERMFAPDAPPASLIECASVLITRGLLLGGDWLALMSVDQFRLEERAGLISRIGGSVSGSRREIGVASRIGWMPTATQAAFLTALETAGRERLNETE
jgi:DNA-binding transcriptional LysR family regulator